MQKVNLCLSPLMERDLAAKERFLNRIFLISSHASFL